MLAYLIKRTVWAVVLLFVVTFATFVLFTVVPGNPAELAAGPAATPQDIARAERYLGLDRPVYVQYGKFLERLLHGSLGRSFTTREEVTDVVAAAAPVTASVVVGGMVLLLAISLPIGIYSGLRPRSLADRAAMVYVLVGVSVPIFWIGLMLQYLVGYRLGWAPISGYCDFVNPATACGGPIDWAHHLVLPWLALATFHAALYVRMIRASVMTTLGEDYVRTARAKGAAEPRVLVQHVLRNALLPIVTLVGLDVGLLLGGAFFVETVFGLPGLGRESVRSIAGLDYSVAEGVILFGAGAVVVANLVTDLAYSWLDPRIRIEA